MTELAALQGKLREFAESGEVAASPLYAHLAAQAAEDTEIAGLLTATAPEDAVPTLLLAAAHRLVIAEPISDLAEYYPSVGGTHGVDEQVWGTFRSFVLDRADRMRELIGTRVVQTNEVRRAAAAYPAVALAAREAGGPIGLLEVGCSAGLLLGMDAYGYRYTLGQSDQLTGGPVRSPLVLTADLALGTGAGKPKVPKKLHLSAKVGLDRHPVDVADEDELAWLEACIWADQPERLRRFGLAASLVRAKPPELVTGDAVEGIEEAAERIPEHLPLVVLSSHVLAYLDEERRAAFSARIAELGARRQLWWVSKEANDAGLDTVFGERARLDHTRPENCAVGMARYPGNPNGRVDVEVLATATSHGDSLTWLV
ncbi:DUF2332 domain-containing protein [Sciscionella sediminilitoris]|uniref:DUF2332 domain-containing protein n=1 Tax=Sciscionella sediminilitoris TaxID=1445613 RepID=UPI0004DFBC5F|nr:DUF2332 domain-containing protein [Sciscionella sp. SE31]